MKPVSKLSQSSIISSFPAELPEDLLLTASAEDFEKHVADELHKLKTTSAVDELTAVTIDETSSSSFAHVLSDTTANCRDLQDVAKPAAQNKTLTNNGGIAYKSTLSPLLDLFTELERAIDGQRLQTLLDAAWREDPLLTLKIVWHARSIHLGKGEQDCFYRCIGWMSKSHPATVLVNLPLLYRSIIEKSPGNEKPTEEEDNMEIIEATDDLMSDEASDVQGRGSHGYWKDISNILVLAAEGKLDVAFDPREVLHKPNEDGPKDLRRRRAKQGRSSGLDGTKRGVNVIEAAKQASQETIRDKNLVKAIRHSKESARHRNIIRMLEKPFYRLLHLSIARHFAAQLKNDKAWLRSGDQKDLKRISLAAKWAPSLEKFHDKHTFLASSIAEILYPRSFFEESYSDSRENYLKLARESYHRLTLAPLRKALEIVERDISAETLKNIKYPQVPSVAMNTYKDLFIKKDFDRFDKYIERVAQGKSRINASVLNPAVLVLQARSNANIAQWRNLNAKQLLEQKIAHIQSKALNGQWADLVSRIKEAGKLTSAIAICDVSGSMTGPVFQDKTTPIDTAIGLSLLLAEVTAAPFGNSIITFSHRPEVLNVGGASDKRSFEEQIHFIQSSTWSMNTDFIAVFERLILPLALKHEIKPEEMVKTVFVFSDMQFDQAESSQRQSSTYQTWETAHERLERKFKEYGYELPKLVYWNINGGSYGHGGGMPKPVTNESTNALMVSGYSSAVLKMFLDGNLYEGEVDEESELEEVVEDKDGNLEVKKVKKKVDPTDGMMRAISHQAFDGLRVVD